MFKKFVISGSSTIDGFEQFAWYLRGHFDFPAPYHDCPDRSLSSATNSRDVCQHGPGGVPWNSQRRRVQLELESSCHSATRAPASSILQVWLLWKEALCYSVCIRSHLKSCFSATWCSESRAVVSGDMHLISRKHYGGRPATSIIHYHGYNLCLVQF